MCCSVLPRFGRGMTFSSSVAAAFINFKFFQSGDESYVDEMDQACRTGNTQIARLLLEKSSSSKTRRFQKHWMFKACRNGFTEIVQLLIVHGALPVRGNLNSLRAARSSRNMDLVLLLMEYGAFDSPRGEPFNRLFMSS